jgi:riboflavin kinase/FMN adenylyltransferase
MQVFNSLSELDGQGPTVLTQGTFDGVHLGHQKILKKVCQVAGEMGMPSTLLTFYPHPRLVLNPDNNELRLLTTLDEKEKILEDIGIDRLVVLPFTKEFSRIEPHAFVRDILVDKLKMKHFIIGYDHRFGKNREGSIESLKLLTQAYNFTLEEIPALDVEESIISSTKIRKHLLEGSVTEASKLLGRTYSLTGTVVKGRKQGRVLGYPTANLLVKNQYKLIPANGVYAVKVTADDQVYYGMMNIGENPTFKDAHWSCEVHIFEFDRDIYGEEMIVRFEDRLRDEVKYERVEELIEQLKRDEIHAKKVLGHT